MAIITGRDCALTVGGKPYANVVQRFALDFEQERVEYPTLSGTRAGSGSESGTLTIQAAYDADETDSLHKALWDAATAGTAVAYVATVGGKTYTGNAVAVRPGVMGEASAVSEFTVELPLDGIPTVGTVTPTSQPATR